MRKNRKRMKGIALSTGRVIFLIAKYRVKLISGSIWAIGGFIFTIFTPELVGGSYFDTDIDEIGMILKFITPGLLGLFLVIQSMTKLREIWRFISSGRQIRKTKEEKDRLLFDQLCYVTALIKVTIPLFTSTNVFSRLLQDLVGSWIMWFLLSLLGAQMDYSWEEGKKKEGLGIFWNGDPIVYVETSAGEKIRYVTINQNDEGDEAEGGE